MFVNAPLEELANPNVTPAVAKAPWYLVGIQELLAYFHPTVAGALPILTIFIAIGAIPYIDRGPRGDGGSSASARPQAGRDAVLDVLRRRPADHVPGRVLPRSRLRLDPAVGNGLWFAL